MVCKKKESCTAIDVNNMKTRSSFQNIQYSRVWNSRAKGGGGGGNSLAFGAWNKRGEELIYKKSL